MWYSNISELHYKFKNQKSSTAMLSFKSVLYLNLKYDKFIFPWSMMLNTLKKKKKTFETQDLKMFLWCGDD